jgi:hypothetical protein
MKHNLKTPNSKKKKKTGTPLSANMPSTGKARNNLVSATKKDAKAQSKAEAEEDKVLDEALRRARIEAGLKEERARMEAEAKEGSKQEAKQKLEKAKETLIAEAEEKKAVANKEVKKASQAKVVKKTPMKTVKKQDIEEEEAQVEAEVERAVITDEDMESISSLPKTNTKANKKEEEDEEGEDLDFEAFVDENARKAMLPPQILDNAEDVEEGDVEESVEFMEIAVGDPAFSITTIESDYTKIDEGAYEIQMGTTRAWLTESEYMEFKETLNDLGRVLEDNTEEAEDDEETTVEEVPKADPVKVKRAAQMRKKYTKASHPTKWWNMPPYLMTIMLIIFLLTTLSVEAALTDHMMTDMTYFLSADFETTAGELLAETSFETFGKMDSTIYRMMFQDLCDMHMLDAVTVSLIIFLTVMIKNKGRIVRAVTMNATLAGNEKISAAISFIEAQCINYVDAASNKFPLVKLPESFCSVSCVYFIAYNENLTLTSLLSSQWFGHLALSDFLQDLHQMYMRFFWTQTVKKTKNKTKNRDNSRKAGVFYTDIYENTIGDTYRFYTYTGDVARNSPATLLNLISYCNILRADSPSVAGNLSTAACRLVPPREDWKFFHPRFAQDPGVTDRDSFLCEGDYDPKSGRFNRALTVGLLSDWMMTFTPAELKAAPTETKITIDDKVNTYKFTT